MAADSILAPCCATIGFFDGVHLGHRSLLAQLTETARKRGMASCVVTFSNHPRQTVQPHWQPQLLCTAREKAVLLRAAGVDRVEMLHFDAAMASLPAREFMLTVLRQRLGAAVLITGYDNRFGHRTAENAGEGFADYVSYGREMGIEVLASSPFDAGQWRVSSSLVRRMLAEGRVDEAAKCLGRPYSISGTVVEGHRIGHRIGFPTANLQPEEPLQTVPENGVYAVQAVVDDNGSAPLRGVLNIGTRPTFGGHRRTLETHLLDFSGDIYGHGLRLSFVARLREERFFPSADDLQRQLRDDIAQAEVLFGRS